MRLTIVTVRILSTSCLSTMLIGVTVEAAPASPARPQIFVPTSLAATPVTGKTIRVAAGGDFQAALNSAEPGDEIGLEAGATYTGNFVLPAKNGNGKWITVRTSDLAGLPKEGVRVGPEHARAMPKIVDPNSGGALRTALNASYWRLIGLEVTVSPTVKNAWALVRLGSGEAEQNTLAVVAHHLILDRLYIHGDPAQSCFRCVALNSVHSAVIDSYLAEGHALGFDAQAIIGWNGPGPLKIVNNYLAGSGENVMFGGADPAIPENLFENNWTHAQNGTAILFTVRNQDGKALWSAVQDVTMIGNVVRNAQTGFVVMGEDSPHRSQLSRRFLIRNNLFERIERSAFMITAGAEDVEIDHNTFVPTNYLAFVMSGLAGRDAAGQVIGKPCRGFKLTNNILGFGLYGAAVDGGKNSFAEAFPAMTWDQNLFVGYGEGRAEWAMKKNAYPAGSLFEPPQTGTGGAGDADWAAVGFADFAQSDYRLVPSSKYKARGTDGKDLGADNDVLRAARKRSK